MMQLQRQVVRLAVGLLGCGGILSAQPSANGATQGFICHDIGGIPTTVARTQRGMVPLIRWNSDYFTDSGFSPTVRCQMVSAKFQTHHQKGQLNYLIVDRVKRSSVICVSDSPSGRCTDVLLTLKPGVDPEFVLRRLLIMRSGTFTPLNETLRRPFVDLKQVLKTAPAEPGLNAESMSSWSDAPLLPESTPPSEGAGTLW